ncbi:hypothetical protein KO533_11710 [Shewanella sp. NKUCC05_KAH]|uniref:hypothetical protein n=1 Tax=Shewanella sp. NKUCC05_KAH TaxID=2842126 RepID=UPI001C5BDC21|nr:hypothetical protein [Shewanella sp. NKUCC05_KAH]MBW3527226.1 hypothetical protein [Shewanella sp. NKUCC05_KAH]
MKPIYDTAIVGVDNKTKIYQTSKAIEIFSLCVDTGSNAFADTLLGFGKTVTENQIKLAEKAYDDVLMDIEHKKQREIEKQNELDLINAYRESLIDIRTCLVNTNNNKVFLLSDSHKLVGRYHSYQDVFNSADKSFIELINLHSLPSDKYVLEPVSSLTVDRLLEVED